MSAETDFIAALAAHAPLTALVAGRISQNTAAPDSALPYVVFTSQHNTEFGLANNVLANNVQFRIECWADDATEADAVADAVRAALLEAGVVCPSRTTGQDPDVGLQATVLVADWWE